MRITLGLADCAEAMLISDRCAKYCDGDRRIMRA